MVPESKQWLCYLYGDIMASGYESDPCDHVMAHWL